jgi:copper transporter 1
MNHSMMDHGSMDHSMTDHASMDHSEHTVDHSAVDHSSHGLDDGHGMKMYFYFSSNATILFEGWTVHSWQGMLGSCLAVFIMAALYEGLKVGREHLLRRSNVLIRYNTMPVPSSDSTLMTETHKTASTRMCSGPHFIQSILHVLQVILSYFLMLIFMTYNVWLCLSVASGAGFGYFLFSWKRAIVVDVNEHCH